MQRRHLEHEGACRAEGARALSGDADGTVGQGGGHDGDVVDDLETVQLLRDREPGLRLGAADRRHLDRGPGRAGAEAEPELAETVAVAPAGPQQGAPVADGGEAVDAAGVLGAPGVALDLERPADALREQLEVLAEVRHRLRVVLLLLAPRLVVGAGHHHRHHQHEDDRERAARDEVHDDAHEQRHDHRDERHRIQLAALGQVGDLPLLAGEERCHPGRAGEGDGAGVARQDAAPGTADDAVSLQVHLELGVADAHDVAALEVRARDLLPAGGDAVGRAEVDDLDDLLDDELGVLARDRLVGQLHLAAATTADVCRPAGEWELLARVGAGPDVGDGRRAAPVDEALPGPGHRDAHARLETALGDRRARVEPAQVLVDEGEGHRGVDPEHARAVRVGGREVGGEVTDRGGGVRRRDEVGLAVAGAEDELQLHASLPFRAARALLALGAMVPRRVVVAGSRRVGAARPWRREVRHAGGPEAGAARQVVSEGAQRDVAAQPLPEALLAPDPPARRLDVGPEGVDLLRRRLGDVEDVAVGGGRERHEGQVRSSAQVAPIRGGVAPRPELGGDGSTRPPRDGGPHEGTVDDRARLLGRGTEDVLLEGARLLESGPLDRQRHPQVAGGVDDLAPAAADPARRLAGRAPTSPAEPLGAADGAVDEQQRRAAGPRRRRRASAASPASCPGRAGSCRPSAGSSAGSRSAPGRDPGGRSAGCSPRAGAPGRRSSSPRTSGSAAAASCCGPGRTASSRSAATSRRSARPRPRRGRPCP